MTVSGLHPCSCLATCFVAYASVQFLFLLTVLASGCLSLITARAASINDFIQTCDWTQCLQLVPCSHKHKQLSKQMQRHCRHRQHILDLHAAMLVRTFCFMKLSTAYTQACSQSVNGMIVLQSWPTEHAEHLPTALDKLHLSDLALTHHCKQGNLPELTNKIGARKSCKQPS